VVEEDLNRVRLSPRALLTISPRTNVTVNHSPSRVDPSALPSLPKGQDLKPAPIDPSIDKWFFISGAAV
jgi:hypothetical protein